MADLKPIARFTLFEITNPPVGNFTFDTNGRFPLNGRISEVPAVMAYQIDDGPPGALSFTVIDRTNQLAIWYKNGDLDETDCPELGQYLITVYAWDVTGGLEVRTRFINRT
jgi:hypothetical protein